MPFNISSRKEDDIAILVVSGEVDLLVVPRFREKANEVANECPRVIVDLTGVAFIDSSGLGIVMAIRKSVERCSIVTSTTQVTRVLDIVGFDSVFSIHTNIEEALAEMKEPS